MSCLFCKLNHKKTELCPTTKRVSIFTSEGVKYTLVDVPCKYCPECNEDYYTEETVRVFERIRDGELKLDTKVVKWGAING